MAFNLYKSPRKTKNEISLAQFPKQPSAVRFASPRKETLMKVRLVYRNVKNAAWVTKRMSHNRERVPGKRRGSNIYEGQGLVSYDVDPMSPKPSSLSEEPDSRIMSTRRGLRTRLAPWMTLLAP